MDILGDYMEQDEHGHPMAGNGPQVVGADDLLMFKRNRLGCATASYTHLFGAGY